MTGGLGGVVHRATAQRQSNSTGPQASPPSLLHSVFMFSLITDVAHKARLHLFYQTSDRLQLLWVHTIVPFQNHKVKLNEWVDLIARRFSDMAL